MSARGLIASAGKVKTALTSLISNKFDKAGGIVSGDTIFGTSSSDTVNVAIQGNGVGDRILKWVRSGFTRWALRVDSSEGFLLSRYDSSGVLLGSSITVVNATGAIGLNGAIAASSTLGVAGATTLSSFSTTGNGTVGGTFASTGAATFSSSLLAAGTWDKPVRVLGKYFWQNPTTSQLIYKNSAPANVGDGLPMWEVVAAPATATSSGWTYQMATDGSFLYICVANNSWRRVAIAAW